MNRRGRIPSWNSMRPRELRGETLVRLRAAARLTAAETLDAAAGVDQLLTAGVERVAVRADFDVDLRLRRTSGELVAAGTAHVRLDVLGMDVGLHVVEDRRGGKRRTGPQDAPLGPPEVEHRLGHEGVHDRRVELAARLAVQLRDRLRHGHGGPVWAVRGHRVEGVAGADDPGAER